jgi:hypothetical protein
MVFGPLSSENSRQGMRLYAVDRISLFCKSWTEYISENVMLILFQYYNGAKVIYINKK